MLNMDYHAADMFFRTATDDEKLEYFKKVPHNPLIDCRGEFVLGKIIDELIEEKSFIFIDGVSGTGKTTLAYRFKEKYGAKVEVLDIDALSLDYMETNAKNMSQLEYLMFLSNYETKFDNYISENLERIVLEKACNGEKAVILVGSYLFVIARTVISYTLGVKHFPHSISITLHESLDTILKRLEERDEMVQTEKVKAEYAIINQILSENPNFLGIGTEYSFLANSQTYWEL